MWCENKVHANMLSVHCVVCSNQISWHHCMFKQACKESSVLLMHVAVFIANQKPDHCTIIQNQVTDHQAQRRPITLPFNELIMALDSASVNMKCSNVGTSLCR